MLKEPIKVVSNTRASTNQGMQRNSIQIQRRLIQEYCNRNNYEIVAEYSEYASGRSDNRIEFNKALKRAEKENLLVVIYRIDRLARSMSVFSQIQNLLPLIRCVELGNQEINLITISILLSMATQESINTSSRVSASIAHLKQNTKNFTWGNPNLHKERIKAQVIRQANAKEHNDKIKKICNELTIAGYDSTKALVERLNELGVMTRRGKPYTYHNLRRVLIR